MRKWTFTVPVCVVEGSPILLKFQFASMHSISPYPCVLVDVFNLLLVVVRVSSLYFGFISNLFSLRLRKRCQKKLMNGVSKQGHGFSFFTLGNLVSLKIGKALSLC